MTPTGERVRPSTAEVRELRRRMWWVVAFGIWVLCVPVLVLRTEDVWPGDDMTTRYLAAIAATLGTAAALRFAYVRIRRQPFWSPWLFALAAALAVPGLLGQAIAEKEEASATAIRLCRERMRVQFDSIPVQNQAFTREDFFEFAAVYCDEASKRGFTLATDPNKVETLQRELLADLLRSGEIRRLR